LRIYLKQFQYFIKSTPPATFPLGTLPAGGSPPYCNPPDCRIPGECFFSRAGVSGLLVGVRSKSRFRTSRPLLTVHPLLPLVPRVQPQPPSRKPPLVCDPNPPDPVRDRERSEEHKEPLSVSHAEDDQREAGANADRGDQGGQESPGKGEVREMALDRPGLHPFAPGRTGPLRLEQSTRQFHAARVFRFDDDETEVVFLFPRPVSAFRGHGLIKTISYDFPRVKLEMGRESFFVRSSPSASPAQSVVLKLDEESSELDLDLLVRRQLEPMYCEFQ